MMMLYVFLFLSIRVVFPRSLLWSIPCMTSELILMILWHVLQECCTCSWRTSWKLGIDIFYKISLYLGFRVRLTFVWNEQFISGSVSQSLYRALYEFVFYWYFSIMPMVFFSISLLFSCPLTSSHACYIWLHCRTLWQYWCLDQPNILCESVCLKQLQLIL